MQTVALPAPLRGHTPEWRALIGLTAPVPRPPAEAVDWDRLVALARRHKVVLGLAPGVAGTACNVPDTARDTLLGLQKTATLRTLSGAGEVVRLTKRLDAAGLPAVFVKGTALATALYETENRRDPGDIDLLVAPDSVTAALRLLVAAGYQTGPDVELLHDRRWGPNLRKAQKDLTLVHPASRSAVELHWRLDAHGWFDPRALLATSSHIRVASVPVPVPTPLDHALYLCVHGVLHGWDRLKWLSDLRQMLSDDGAWIGGDWPALAELAVSRGLDRALWSAFATAAPLDAAPLPDAVARLAASENVAHSRMLQAMMTRAEALEDPGGLAARLGVIRRLHLSARLTGTATLPRALRGMVRLAVNPTVKDLTVLKLPYALRAGYVLLRPTLIARRLLLGSR